MICQYYPDLYPGVAFSGQPLFVIATEEHRAAFASQLATEGFDVPVLERAGRVTMLDARATLATFMSGAVPDANRFKTVIGAVIAPFAQDGVTGSAVRLY